MDKIELCDMFTSKLKEWKIKHQVFNNGFHIQIQRIHNFYPTKRSYYNSESNEKCFYPEFVSGNQFLTWLSTKTVEKPKEKTFTVSEILKILEDCESIDLAIMVFATYQKKQ